jgi:quinol monooxygenase YgiN
VVVYYCTFSVETDDRTDFDDWFLGLVQQCRRAPGCVAYEYSVSPEWPTRRCLFAAWESEEHFAEHRISPGHVEMLALGAGRGVTDVVVDYWFDGVHTTARDAEVSLRLPEAVHDLVRRRRLRTQAG